MAKTDLDDGGISLTQQKTGKELWVPLHTELAAEMKSWNVEPPWFFVQNAKERSVHPRALQGSLDAPHERYSRRQDQEGGVYVSWPQSVERGEA